MPYFDHSEFNGVSTDLIRLFGDCPDFSEPATNMGHKCNQSWFLLFYLASYEQDDNYILIDSGEGRRVYPKTDSAAVWLTKAFLSEISNNLDMKVIEIIWIEARSLLFLEWFLDITQSTNLSVCLETGWSPIVEILSYRFCHWSDYDLITSKIRLLIEMGASPHYRRCKTMDGPHGVTPTSLLILDPVILVEWREILQEKHVDIEHFVEQELKEGPLLHDGWNKETLLKLFAVHLDHEQGRSDPRGWWHRCDYCNDYGGYFRKPWMVYLEALKNGQDFNELSDYSEWLDNHDQDFIDNDQDFTDADEKESGMDDQDSDADEKNSDGYDQVPETWYCLSCVRNKVWLSEDLPLTLAMPGSFD